MLRSLLPLNLLIFGIIITLGVVQLITVLVGPGGIILQLIKLLQAGREGGSAGVSTGRYCKWMQG